MSEEELRREAVRRRLAGESPDSIAEALGRTSRWVRKWVARHEEAGQHETWASERSRAPLRSPSATPADVVDQIIAARQRLVANPRARYGSLAVTGMRARRSMSTRTSSWKPTVVLPRRWDTSSATR
ncbi:MAG TPA: helix-turn-helix domain-containing protein [Acidimicrobiales bacterium]|nr:helix-turn-helix domain-containing protein [Acidimicrobiales bacterium]